MKKESFTLPNPIADSSEKIMDAQHNAKVDLSHALTRSITKATDVKKDVTTKDRIMHAALGALASLATTGAVSKIFKSKIPLPLYLTNAASMGTAGYFTPDIINIIKDEARGEISHEEARDSIRMMERPSMKAFNETQEVSELYGGLMKKSSFTFDVARYGYRGARGAGSILRKGLFPGQDPTTGRKALSHAVKGGVLAGSGYAGYKGFQKATQKGYKKNYTTFLRNNVLSGNIHPSELSQADLVSTRALGMR